MKGLLLLVFFPVGLFAGWTVWVWAAVALEVTPAELLSSLPVITVTLLAAGGLAAWSAIRAVPAFAGQPDGDIGGEPLAVPGRALGAWIALTSVALFLWLRGGPQPVLWVLIVLATPIPAVPALDRTPWKAPELRISWLDWTALGLASVTITFFSLAVLRGDPDDIHFLDAAASFLDEPDLPLFATDTLFQVYDRSNGVYALNLGQSWDALAGFLARVTGVDLLTLYYSILPILAAVLAPATWLLFCRLCGLDRAALGLLLAIPLLYLLDFGGAMFNAFLEHRLYQGKGSLLTAGLPLAFLAALLHARVRDGRSTTLLAVVLIAGAGFSSSGLYLMPMAVGIGLVAFTPWRRRALLASASGFAAALLPCVVVLVLFHVLRDTGTVLANYDYGSRRTVLFQFGGGLEGRWHLALYHFATSLLCVLGALRRNRALVGLGLALLLLGLNPWLPGWLGEVTGIVNLYWRFFWMIPLGLLVTACIGLLAESVPRREAGARLRARALVITALAWSALAFWRLGPPADPVIGTLRLSKAPPYARGLVEEFRKLERQGQGEPILVAAPEWVARHMNLYPGAPRPLYLRTYYFRLIPGMEGSEAYRRIKAVRYLLGRRVLRPDEWIRLEALSRELGVTHIVFRRAQVPAGLRAPADCLSRRSFLICPVDALASRLRPEGAGTPSN